VVGFVGNKIGRYISIVVFVYGIGKDPLSLYPVKEELWSAGKMWER
jgi:hypothetical protein